MISPIRSIIRFSLLFMACLLCNSAIGQLSVAKVFSDNMVIQRDQNIKVWGWSKAGDDITVSFQNNEYKGTTNSDGKWMVSLPRLSAGGPFTMNIKSKDDQISLQNILVGDVWLCSGQSNMEWTVKNSNNAEQEIADANHMHIRHFKVPRTYADLPEEQLADGHWVECNPTNAGDFTAVGYYFAKSIQSSVDVPIGLLNSSWGGSRIEPWMRSEILGGMTAKNSLDKLKEEGIARKKKIEEISGPLTEEDKGIVNGNPIWASSILDDSDWSNINTPELWESQSYEGFDGIAWYRKTVMLSKEEIESGITLGLGKIDDSDISYVNGNEIGRTINSYNTIRNYEVDQLFLQEGENVIAVRVDDTGGGGGIWGSESDLFIQIGNEKKSLSGDWKFKVSAWTGSYVQAPNQIPTILYNKMIHPILDFPIKGVIWYQGESNAGEKDAYPYRDLFASMITDWRKLYGIGDFPFLFVQLANFMQVHEEPTESNWAVLRESQSDVLRLNKTAQAVIIDIGEADDIHPRNKQDVGYRLALGALKHGYNQNVVYSGPTYMSHEVRLNKVVLSFRHIGSALYAKDKYGYLRGFTIAGSDGKFVWAKAKIIGNKVEVWHEAINKPMKLRYAWADNPDDANLYNKEGLPASPFRIEKL